MGSKYLSKDDKSSGLIWKILLVVLCLLLMAEIMIVVLVLITGGEVPILTVNILNRVSFSIGGFK